MPVVVGTFYLLPHHYEYEIHAPIGDYYGKIAGNIDVTQWKQLVGKRVSAKILMRDRSLIDVEECNE